MFFLYFLRKFFYKKRNSVRHQYARVLPFGEYISDRWEKSKYLGFGDSTSIYDSSLILGEVRVGKNCWIGPFTILDGSGGVLSIGDNCHISAGTHIYTHDTVNQVLYGHPIEKSSTYIGNNCYIGPNCTIAKGVKIGDFVVIGANTVIKKNIKSHTKAYGNPLNIVDLPLNYESID